MMSRKTALDWDKPGILGQVFGPAIKTPTFHMRVLEFRRDPARDSSLPLTQTLGGHRDSSGDQIPATSTGDLD